MILSLDKFYITILLLFPLKICIWWLNKMPQSQRITIQECCTRCKTQFQREDDDQSKTILIQGQYLCEQCLEFILLKEQDQAKSLQQSYIYFKQYESSINNYELNKIVGQRLNEKQQGQVQLSLFLEEQKILTQHVDKLKNQCENLKSKVLYIQTEEEKFWQNINRFQKRSVKLQDKSLGAKIDKTQSKQQFNKLTAKSIYHQLFKITIEQNVGYLQNLVMGKKSDGIDVQWDQFNTGLGHLFLGFNILILKYDYCCVKLKKIKLKGSLTKVLLDGKQSQSWIGYSKDNQKAFGEVLQSFLYQVSQFSFHLTENLNLEYNPDLKLPYPIKQAQYKIGDINIDPSKISQRQRWNKWTQAMKYLLINFKHLFTVHMIYGKN